VSIVILQKKEDYMKTYGYILNIIIYVYIYNIINLSLLRFRITP